MFKRLFLLILLGSTLLLANYQIKIGIYSNGTNLRKNLSKIKSSYRKDIVLTKKRNRTYLNSVVYKDKKRAKRALRIYRRVFRDAFIAKTKARRTSKLTKSEKRKQKEKTKAKVKAQKLKKKKLQAKKQKLQKQKQKERRAKIKKREATKLEEKKSLKTVVKKSKTLLLPSKVSPKKLKEVKRVFNAQVLLDNKIIYLCYDKKKTFMKKRLMEMHFMSEFIDYHSLLNENKPLKVPYHFDGESVVLKMAGFEFTHTIYENNKTFLHLRSFKEGKSGTTLRYYFDKNAALEFVQSQD